MSKCKECDGRGRVNSSYAVNVRGHEKGSGDVLTTENCDACEGLGYFAETPAGELLPNGIRHLMPMIRVASITLDGSTLVVPAKDIGQHISTLDDSLGASEGDEVTYIITFETMLLSDYEALGEFDGF